MERTELRQPALVPVLPITSCLTLGEPSTSLELYKTRWFKEMISMYLVALKFYAQKNKKPSISKANLLLVVIFSAH